MKVSKKIKQKILRDNQFSLKMALALNKTQEAVKQSARRNSSKLSEASYIAFFKSQGFTEDEIFSSPSHTPLSRTSSERGANELIANR